jgi:CubicO group peptidase (beta-lactamase class C family)
MKTRIILYQMLSVGVFLSLISCKPDYKKKFADKFNKVDSIFIKYDSVSPGCAIGIVYKGDLIYAKGYGMADIENKIPNEPDKLFDIASTSKQFTAFSILLLEEQGKLSLEDKIKKYIPELPECYEPVQIKHLLTHTSGIRDHYALMDLTGIDEVSSKEENWANHNYNENKVFGILQKQRELNFAPGTYHQYCNSGFYLAGKIVERISGMSLRKFYKEQIFNPLKMENTFLYDDSTFYHKNRTMGYSKSKDGYKRNLIKYETYGDGQIMTNVYDLYSWDKNFYNNELGQKNQSLIEKAYTRYQLKDGQTVDYSIGGLEVSKYNGLTVIDRIGGTQGISSDIVRFPEQKFTIICLSNYQDLSPDPWRASLKIADIFLQDYFVAETKENTESTSNEINISQSYINEITGSYFNDISKEYCTIKFTDGRLKWYNKNLIPIDSVSFKIEDWSTTIKFKKAKSDWKMHWQSFTYPVETYTKKNQIELDENALEAKKGKYYSPELNLNCQVTIKNGSLLLIDSSNEISAMEVLFENTFQSKYNGQDAIIEFENTKNADKIALRINTDWIKNLKFEKITG